MIAGYFQEFRERARWFFARRDSEFHDKLACEANLTQNLTKLPVIAFIPRIMTEKEKKRKSVKRRRLVYASSLGVVGLAITTATVHFFIFRLDVLLTKLPYVRKILLPE